MTSIFISKHSHRIPYTVYSMKYVVCSRPFVVYVYSLLCIVYYVPFTAFGAATGADLTGSTGTGEDLLSSDKSIFALQIVNTLSE